MRQVIEDWLGYTVVQNGKPRPEAIKLDEVAAEIVQSRRAFGADGEAPVFTLDVDHAVFADPRLLRQLLDNLVGNAVKYTSPDHAPVQLVSRHDDEPGWVTRRRRRQRDRDPGGRGGADLRGVPPRRAEGRSAGTGLGLALTRRIRRSHGGQLSARRNPEGGSTFTFTLPEACSGRIAPGCRVEYFRAWRCSAAGRGPSSRRTSTTRRTTRAGAARPSPA